jgi:hypothetical protein
MNNGTHLSQNKIKKTKKYSPILSNTTLFIVQTMNNITPSTKTYFYSLEPKILAVDVFPMAQQSLVGQGQHTIKARDHTQTRDAW